MNPVRVPWSDASFLVYTAGSRSWSRCSPSCRSSRGSMGGRAGQLVGAHVCVLAVLASLSSGRAASLPRPLRSQRRCSVRRVPRRAARLVRLAASHQWQPVPGLPLLAAHARAFDRGRVGCCAAALPLPAAGLRGRRSAWFFVTDLVSGGGNWSAIVTIAYGLVLFGHRDELRRRRLADLRLLAPRRRGPDDRRRAPLVLPRRRLRTGS